MTVQTYKWSDTSAPSLDGQAGSLITVLDAVLVGTGGIAYGSTASAGWTKSYSGTNLAAYRQGTGSNQFYLKVRDDGPGAAGAQECRIRGFETMTQVTASNDGTDGTNLFPTVAQLANGVFVRKSAAASSVVRPWIIVADQRTFYMFVLTGDTAGNYVGWMFGEFYSLKTSDSGRCMIVARSTENSSSLTSTIETMDMLTLVNVAVTNHYIARDATGAVGSIACGKVGDASFTNLSGSNAMVGLTAMLNPADHFIYLAPMRVTHATGGNTVRGRMRGFWHWGHLLGACSDGQTFSGQGTLAGKSFLVIKQSGNSGVYIMETSNTWDTN